MGMTMLDTACVLHYPKTGARDPRHLAPRDERGSVTARETPP